MRRAKVMLGVVVAVVVGCGAPRFDATSPETVNTSLAALGKGLNEVQKKQLTTDIMTVTVGPMLKTAFAGAFSKEPAKKPEVSDIMKPLNGLTVAEIHEAAEKVRAEHDAARKSPAAAHR